MATNAVDPACCIDLSRGLYAPAAEDRDPLVDFCALMLSMPLSRFAVTLLVSMDEDRSKRRNIMRESKSLEMVRPC